MPSVEKALVVRHRKVAPDFYELEFIAPQIAREVLPGQFINIRVSDTYDPLLRRPFSVFDVDKRLGIITLFYKVVGRGTRFLSKIHIESRLDVMGPLGNSFSIPQKLANAFLVGGGVGIAPLVYLARVLKERKIKFKVLMGASTSALLPGRQIFEALGIEYLVSTDDGSIGDKGNVNQLLRSQLDVETCDFLYACGPEPMLKEINDLALSRNIAGELSLEEHMACGVGACLGCARKVKDGDMFRYAKVCSEGPIFKIGQVIFDGQTGGDGSC